MNVDDLLAAELAGARTSVHVDFWILLFHSVGVAVFVHVEIEVGFVGEHLDIRINNQPNDEYGFNDE